MTATIGQVAKRAGVSKATVSRVINNSKPVSERTKALVLEAIDELEFKPNPAARSLVSKKSRMIGVVVTDIANLFVSVLVKGIEQVAYEKGYNIFICNSHGSPEKEMELLMMLKDKRVDGIIFLTSDLKEEHKSFFRESDLPTALVNVSYNQDKTIGIRIDNFKAAYDMTSYFLKKGYKKVGMIRASFADQFTGRDRFVGYWKALLDHDVAFDENLVRIGSLETMDGYKAAKELVNDNNDIEALFVACDLMAFGAIKAIIDLGYRVPEDIEVAGFDDVPMASFYHPTLTTVRQPIEDMGRYSAKKLVKLIEGAAIDQWEIVLPHELVFRDSTAKNVESKIS